MAGALYEMGRQVLKPFSGAMLPLVFPGRLFILSAPAGTGKSSLVAPLLETFNGSLTVAVTCTTRPKRPNEVDGIDYHFISESEFKKKIDSGDFLEWVEMHGFFYGSSRSEIEAELASGRHVLMIIDTEGAKKVKEILEPVMLFLLPPSMDVLRSRLIGRNTESNDSVEKRMKKAEEELVSLPMYDYTIINDLFHVCLLTVTCIIVAEVQKHKHCVEMAQTKERCI